jgi:sec-independent protein translocase protein TatB
VDILGIGPLELVLILVIALLVFGPDKLPEIGAKLGKGVRELRQLSREISQGVNTLTEPIDELRKPFDDASQIVHEVSDTAESLRNPGRALQNALNQQLTTASAEPAAEDNTIAPPRSPEPAEPVEPAGAIPATSSPATDPLEMVPPAAPAPTAAVATLDEAAAGAVAYLPATESAARTSER